MSSGGDTCRTDGEQQGATHLHSGRRVGNSTIGLNEACSFAYFQFLVANDWKYSNWPDEAAHLHICICQLDAAKIEFIRWPHRAHLHNWLLVADWLAMRFGDCLGKKKRSFEYLAFVCLQTSHLHIGGNF